MSDQISGPACAHKTVIGRNNERHGVVTQEWWVCNRCGLRFAPIPRSIDQKEFDAGFQSGEAAPPDTAKFGMGIVGPLPPVSNRTTEGGDKYVNLQWWHSEVSKKLMESAVEKKRLESEINAAQLSLTSVRTDNKHLTERVAYHLGSLKTAEGKLDACEQELKIVRNGADGRNQEIETLRRILNSCQDTNRHLEQELKLVRADRDRFIGMGGTAKIDLQPTLDQLKSDAHKDQQKINQLNEKIKWLTQVPRLMLEWITAKITTYELDLVEFDKKLSGAGNPYSNYSVEVEKWVKKEHIRMLKEFKSSIEDTLKRNGQ